MFLVQRMKWFESLISVAPRTNPRCTGSQSPIMNNNVDKDKTALEPRPPDLIKWYTSISCAFGASFFHAHEHRAYSFYLATHNIPTLQQKTRKIAPENTHSMANACREPYLHFHARLPTNAAESLRQTRNRKAKTQKDRNVSQRKIKFTTVLEKRLWKAPSIL